MQDRFKIGQVVENATAGLKADVVYVETDRIQVAISDARTTRMMFLAGAQLSWWAIIAEPHPAILQAGRHVLDADNKRPLSRLLCLDGITDRVRSTTVSWCLDAQVANLARQYDPRVFAKTVHIPALPAPKLLSPAEIGCRRACRALSAFFATFGDLRKSRRGRELFWGDVVEACPPDLQMVGWRAACVQLAERLPRDAPGLLRYSRDFCTAEVVHVVLSRIADKRTPEHANYARAIKPAKPVEGPWRYRYRSPRCFT